MKYWILEELYCLSLLFIWRQPKYSSRLLSLSQWADILKSVLTYCFVQHKLMLPMSCYRLLMFSLFCFQD